MRRPSCAQRCESVPTLTAVSAPRFEPDTAVSAAAHPVIAPAWTGTVSDTVNVATGVGTLSQLASHFLSRERARVVTRSAARRSSDRSLGERRSSR
jgi:hypothetical protein